MSPTSFFSLSRQEFPVMLIVEGWRRILTNLAVRRSRKSVRHVALSYITRWRIENVIRFVKQSYGIRQFLYGQPQGLTKLLEPQSALPIQPTLFDS